MVNYIERVNLNMSNQNKNDERILELRSQIKEKKLKLKTKKKFTPVTNCSIEIDGLRYNLNVLQKDLLILLLVKLQAYKMAANELNVNEIKISGYDIKDWIADIQLKIEIISFIEKEDELKQIENKLNIMLSNEKKVEFEINEITDLLNG
jgi:hypothetical protein